MARSGEGGCSLASIYGLMPKNHPLVGKFHHAPCASRLGGKYDQAGVVTMTEHQRIKKLRNNPYTGQFHSAPKSYSSLHNLRKLLRPRDKNTTQHNTTPGVVGFSSDQSSNYDVVSTSGGDRVVMEIEDDEEEKELSRQNSFVWYKGFKHFSSPDLMGLKDVDSLTLISKSLTWMYQDNDKRNRNNTTTRKPRSQSTTIPEFVKGTTQTNRRSFTTSAKLPDENGGDGIDIWDKKNEVVVDDKASTSSVGKRASNDEELHDPCSLNSRFGGNLFQHWVVNAQDSVSSKYDFDVKDKDSILGDGTYSKVVCARLRSSGCEVAIKVIKKKYLCSKEEKQMVKREVEIQQRIEHRNVIRLLETYETKSTLYMILEKANNGNLDDLLCANRDKRLNETECCVLLSQVFDALVYLHDNGVLHADIKPSNILLTYTGKSAQHNPTQPNATKPNTTQHNRKGHILGITVKLCDFGLSRKVPNVKFFKYTGDVRKAPYTNFRGTMGYAAPEILRREPYSLSADIWSMGIIMFEVVSGAKPFTPYSDCLNKSLVFPKARWDAVSSSCVDLTKALLVLDPTGRMKSKEARCHSWFASNELSVPY